MTDTTTAAPPVENPALPARLNFDLSRLGLAMLPVTPVSFSGPEGAYAWGRLIVYGGIAVAAWPRSHKLSTVFGVAAGVCILTSLAGNSWGKK